jgi:hypothetical protein
MGGQKSLGFVFGIALVVGVVLAVTTWAAEADLIPRVSSAYLRAHQAGAGLVFEVCGLSALCYADAAWN